MSHSTSSALPKIAILASGRGSNFDAIADAVAQGKLAAEIVCVLSDRADAPVLTKASARGLRAIHVAPPATSAGDLDSRRRVHDQEVVTALRAVQAEWIVMAGYMRVVTPVLLDAFKVQSGDYSRVVNIHPSLLPAFPGVESYQRAFEHGCALAGVTVHLVSEGVDAGPICAQESFAIGECRDVAEIERLGLAIEHRLYPQTLQWLLHQNFKLVQHKERLSVRKS